MLFDFDLELRLIDENMREPIPVFSEVDFVDKWSKLLTASSCRICP